jgi:hypothetical protein
VEGSEERDTDYGSLFNFIESKASGSVRLSESQTREVVASVLVDFWDLLRNHPHLANALLANEEIRDPWVSKRLGSAFRQLGRGDRKRNDWRQVELSFEPADDRSAAEAVETKVVLEGITRRLSRSELSTLATLLEGYAEDLTDSEMAERLGLPPSTFHSRKRKLLERIERAFGRGSIE